jgi:hypothetical protein
MNDGPRRGVFHLTGIGRRSYNYVSLGYGGLRMRYLGLFLGLVVCVNGCASSAPGAQGSSRNVITQEQIADTQAITVLDAIRTLHPNWLRARGQTRSAADPTAQTPTVYLDGTRMGGLAVLGVYQVRDIFEIRYLDPGQASIRYGMGFPRGIIELISLRR